MHIVFFWITKLCFVFFDICEISLVSSRILYRQTQKLSIKNYITYSTTVQSTVESDTDKTYEFKLRIKKWEFQINRTYLYDLPKDPWYLLHPWYKVYQFQPKISSERSCEEFQTLGFYTYCNPSEQCTGSGNSIGIPSTTTVQHKVHFL